VTRRRQESSTRVVQSLAGTSTAQVQARVRKKYGAILVRSLVRSTAAQTMHRSRARTADSAIEPASSATRVRVATVAGSTTGSGPAGWALTGGDSSSTDTGIGGTRSTGTGALSMAATSRAISAMVA